MIDGCSLLGDIVHITLTSVDNIISSTIHVPTYLRKWIPDLPGLPSHTFMKEEDKNELGCSLETGDIDLAMMLVVAGVIQNVSVICTKVQHYGDGGGKIGLLK